MRLVLLLAAAMLAGAPARANSLPVPPIPPESPKLAEAAPVPDVDAAAPAVPASDAPSVSVVMYRAAMYDPGVGFTPGSRYQSSEDKKAIQTPGVSINVPLK